eukprot:m.159253 g.159253  ORF g.159253 m.159253 type:complete len:129 (+) comp10256_c1_seq1:49-435(+)
MGASMAPRGCFRRISCQRAESERPKMEARLPALLPRAAIATEATDAVDPDLQLSLEEEAFDEMLHRISNASTKRPVIGKTQADARDQSFEEEEDDSISEDEFDDDDDDDGEMEMGEADMSMGGDWAFA